MSQQIEKFNNRCRTLGIKDLTLSNQDARLLQAELLDLLLYIKNLEKEKNDEIQIVVGGATF